MSGESFGNLEFPIEIDGSRRKSSLGVRKKLTGPGGGRGLRELSRTLGEDLYV